MNAHFNSTNPQPNAKACGSVLDLDAVAVGSIVYVQAGTDQRYVDGEGMQVVATVDRDLLTSGTGDVFLRSQVVDHLDGIIIRAGVVSNPITDAVLIAMGAEFVELVPKCSELWADIERARETLDRALAEANLTLRSADLEAASKLPAYGPWQDAYTRYDREAGNRAYMLKHAINHCRAHTPRGVYYQTVAHWQELLNDGSVGLNDGGVGLDGEETHESRRARQIMEDAKRVADMIDPPAQPTGTLAELIEAHRVAAKAFEDSIDGENEASSALREQPKPLTPSRIQAGQAVRYIEVDGTDPDADVAAIEAEHARWAKELNIAQVEAIAPAGAKQLRRQINASLSECVKLYHSATAPQLQARSAPFMPAIQAYNVANDAEEAALEALHCYRPADMREIAALSRYLLGTGRYTHFATAEYAEQLLTTFSSLDAKE